MERKSRISRDQQKGTMSAKNEKRFQALVEKILEGYFECGLDGTITYSNETFASFFDIKREKIIGLHCSALFDNAFACVISDLLQSYDQTEAGKKWTPLSVAGGPGGTKTLEIFPTPILDQKEKPAGFRCIARDVSPYLKVQKALEESEKKYRELVENANDIIYRNDSQGNFKYMNSFGVKKLGYAPDEILSMNYQDIIPIEYRDEIFNFYKEQLEEEINQTYHELPILKKDGRSIWVGQYVSRVINERGEAEFFGIARDITDFKSIQDALVESEEKYRTILESMKEGYYQTDLRGKITFVNNAFTVMVGMDLHSILGRSYRDFFSPETADKIFKVFSSVYRSSERAEFSDWELLHKSGKSRTISASVELFYGKTGKKAGFRGIVRDLTDKKQYIEALIDSERRFRELVEYLPEIVFELDTGGSILYINQRTTEILGYTPEELLGTNGFNIIVADQRERAARGLGKTLHGKRYNGEGYTFQGKDRLVPIHLYTTPIQEAGITIGIRGIAIDITNIIEAENTLRESQEKFRTMIEHSSEIISIIDNNSIIKYESQSVLQVLGYSQEERLGKNSIDYIHPDDKSEVLKKLQESAWLKNGEITLLEFRHLHRDGTWRYMESTGSNLFRNPLIQGLLLNTRDVTERKISEKAMKLHEEKYRRLYNNALVGMLTVDFPTKTILETNDLGYTLFGHGSRGDIIGTDFFSLFADPGDITGLMRRLESQGEVFNFEAPLLDTKGNKFWTEITAKKNDENREILVVIIDISKRKQAEELLAYYTFYDQLTKLPNREMFTTKLRMEIVKSQRRDRPRVFAVMCLGLDKFKNINEMHGPVAGDKLLQKIASKMKISFREDDLVSRLDGDKFMVLFTDIGNPEGIVDVVQKAFGVFSDPFIVESNVFHITPSIGVSIFPSDGAREDTLMRNAETAMYHAKERGRNTYYLYNEGMNAEIIKRIRLEEELRHAIIRNEFLAHYQPKVTQNGDIIGMETLIRWRSPDRGLVPPFEFIPLAEKNGMIEEIGNIILYQACKQNARWQREGLPSLKVAVNLSPYQFNHPDMVSNIIHVLKDTKLEPLWLELEITESGIMSNEAESIEKLKELNALGLSMSIDDFGTGYSSLSKLKDYPIDMLKIDKSFIDLLPDNQKSATIATTIIDLAHNLDFKVVAEGVEFKEQLDFLVANKCDFYQGYYFSRPLPPEDFATKLKA